MDQSFSTQNLDHLGIVAGICQEIDWVWLLCILPI